MKYVIAALGQFLGAARTADRAADSASAQAAHLARDWSKTYLPTRENLSFGSGNLHQKGNNSFQIVNDTSLPRRGGVACDRPDNLPKTKGNFTIALEVSKPLHVIMRAGSENALKQEPLVISISEISRKTTLALFEMTHQHKQILLDAGVV